MADLTNRNSDKFMLRLPDGMRDRIKAAADLNGRSMNAEIIQTLEEEYPITASDPEIMEIYQILTRYIHDRPNFTADDEARLSALTSARAIDAK